MIDAVANALSSETNESKSAEELATAIVTGIFDLVAKGFRQPPPPLEVGLVYNFAWRPEAMSLVWASGGTRWLMGRSSEYGLLTSASTDSVLLRYRKISPRAAFLQPDSDKYVVGDWVHSFGEKAQRYKVVAVAQSTALLEGPRGTYTAFRFAELDKSFRFWRKRERN